MPFEYAWKLILPGYSEVEMEAYLDDQKSYLKRTSQHEPCTVCQPRHFEHSMHYVIYICNSSMCKAVGHGLQCDWYAKSVMCEATQRCVVWQHGHHLTSQRSPPRGRLNLAMKRFVREQTDAKLTPSRILNKMIDKFLLDDATEYLPRVQRYSHHYRTSKLADTNNIDDMEALIASSRYHDGLDDSTSFAFGYPTGPTGDHFLTSGSEDDPFVVGLKTKALMRNLAHAATSILHIDATFKLNTSNFPVVIIGVSDVCRQFHPVCFFSTSDMKQAQIESILRAMFRTYKLITDVVAEVKFIMADADRAQRNAMEAVAMSELETDNKPSYLMCFFHVMANVKKYIAGMSTPSRELVFKHLYRWHYTRTPSDMRQREAEAMEAWSSRPDCKEFVRKFSKQWTQGLFSAWHCFATLTGFAKTNNPVEQFNKQVKRDYMLRTRINVNMLARR